ncbi:predicted phosphatase [Candidatus Moduliflexus flocculans]|uniref:Predicted phosphatase n=1 Tax=Candidatus Moduliflexus flocculans TaxID=1499966 RepID=A0A0S6VUN4_9BACT|nr:predicted phosphatase [Candidatus Moduliflexus flocculans]
MAIAEQFFGELPVGNAFILQMNTPQFPFLLVAPTMRIPGNVSKTINAYLAMRALLIAIIQHNASHEKQIKSIAISGFCSGVGGMFPEESASQMRIAYDMIIGEQWKRIVHPALAPYAMRNE